MCGNAKLSLSNSSSPWWDNICSFCNGLNFLQELSVGTKIVVWLFETCFLSLGLVQSGSGVRPWWVLCSLRGSRLPPSPELPEGPDGLLREQRAGWPYAAALQLCLLCLPRPRKQVGYDDPTGLCCEREARREVSHTWEALKVFHILKQNVFAVESF